MTIFHVVLTTWTFHHVTGLDVSGLLSSLGVSHPALERVAAISGKRGIHAKLTGAGGEWHLQYPWISHHGCLVVFLSIHGYLNMDFLAGGGFAFALLTPSHSREIVSETIFELEVEWPDFVIYKFSQTWKSLNLVTLCSKENGFECWETDIGGEGISLMEE